MRIIARVLGIATGGCLLVLFFYLVLALPGVLSDQDSIVTRATRAPDHPRTTHTIGNETQMDTSPDFTAYEAKTSALPH